MLFLVILMGAFPMKAQVKQENPSPIIFIYDASGSMWGQLQGETKMKIARDVLLKTVNGLPENQHIGFVAYGHRNKSDCKDVEFMVDVENGTKAKVTKALEGIVPLGRTPLADAALMVIDNLRKTQLKATIILITDGIESCGGNICDVIAAAKKEGIDFKLHIIGFGIGSENTEQLKCAAKAGNGNYYDATDAGGLGDVLNQATSMSVDKPNGNVSVFALKNGIAIDALVKASDITGKRKPISVRTYRDTGFFYLPPGKYDFEVTPLEGTDVNKLTLNAVESFDDKIIHKTISFDGGKIVFKTTNNGEDWDCLVKVLDAKGKVVANGRTYDRPKEIEVNPGTYKVSIQALRGMEGIATYKEMENVKIEAGGSTPVEHNFTTGNFEIVTKVGSDNIDAIVNITEITTGKNVSNARTYDRGAKFILNNGKYKVKVAPLGDHKTKPFQTINIEIEQGKLVTKELKF